MRIPQMRVARIFVLLSTLLSFVGISATGRAIAEFEQVETAEKSAMNESTDGLRKSVGKITKRSLVVAYSDSLVALRDRIFAPLEAEETDSVHDGHYYRLFVPPTFYHSPIAHTLGPDTYDDDDNVSEFIDNTMLTVHLRRPDLVKFTESEIRRVGTLREDIIPGTKSKIELANFSDELPEDIIEGVPHFITRRPNFWTFSGEQNLQIMQDYVSENWYKGGEENFSMLANVVLNANYNNKQKVKFENKLEMKLGVQTSPSDTIHRIKTNNDLLRYTGKFGLQATKRWYYSLQVLAYTQFAHGLKSNDTKIYSDFMSPFDLNIGLGIDYSIETKNKKITGSVNISLISLNFKYVDRLDLSSSNGLEEDKHTLVDYGSQLTTSITWQIIEPIKWTTRLYWYTTYDRSLLEWENTFTLTVNKYISATIFVYPRFDDSTDKNEVWDYWQLKEYSSLGLTYSF